MEIAAQKKQISKDDLTALRKWNWGPFFLGPIWALANKLEVWAILYFVPPITILYWVYLPLRGNELAFRKSQLSLRDFIELQDNWSNWGIRFLVASLAISLLIAIIDISRGLNAP
jgi:ABC-type spermidine/putrescine transport system permease subunit I